MAEGWKMMLHRIELQAVGGVVLAAIGLWYDDFTDGGSPVTNGLLNTLNIQQELKRTIPHSKQLFHMCNLHGEVLQLPNNDLSIIINTTEKSTL